jgi:hypothetical protein
MTPMHCALVHPSAGQRAVKLINTGTVDVKIEATAYPMAEATRPSAAELLATGPGPPGWLSALSVPHSESVHCIAPRFCMGAQGA